MLYRMRKGSKPLLMDKMQEEKGLTLVEMLCATLILILLSLLVGSGLNMAADSYHDVVLLSETKLLLSTLSDAVADELRYADDVSSDDVSGQLLSYTSELYGKDTSLIVDVSGQIYANVLSGEGGSSDSYLILPAGVYGGGTWTCGVPDDGLKIDVSGNLFTVKLKVQEMREGSSGRSFVPSGIQAETAFTVRGLNGS